MIRSNKYRHKFDKLVINNRWRQPFYLRSDTWVVFGLSRRYFSPTEYEWILSLFGIDIRIWMFRLIIKKNG